MLITAACFTVRAKHCQACLLQDLYNHYFKGVERQ